METIHSEFPFSNCISLALTVAVRETEVAAEIRVRETRPRA
jgi:hypothetical protein